MNALAARSRHSLGAPAGHPNAALRHNNGPNDLGEGLKDQILHEPYRTEHKVGDWCREEIVRSVAEKTGCVIGGRP